MNESVTISIDRYDKLVSHSKSLDEIERDIKDKNLVLTYKELEYGLSKTTCLYFSDSDKVLKDVMESLHKEQQKVIDLNTKIMQMQREIEKLVEEKQKLEKFKKDFEDGFADLAKNLEGKRKKKWWQ